MKRSMAAECEARFKPRKGRFKPRNKGFCGEPTVGMCNMPDVARGPYKPRNHTHWWDRHILLYRHSAISWS